MRTTLAIDDDVLDAARKLADQQHRSVGEAISDLASRPADVGDDSAHAWFEQEGCRGWTACAITQNGVIRILGHSRYPNTAGSPGEASQLIGDLCALEGHRFWPDELNMFDGEIADSSENRTPGRVAGSYLLTLAALGRGRLAALDGKLSIRLARAGRRALHLVDPGAAV